MSPARRRFLLGLLIVSGLLNYADRQIIAVLKPMLQSDLKWSDADYGALAAIFQFAAAFAYLGAGWVVDRVGWRRANPLATGAWSLAAMAHAFTRSVREFAFARAALGVTEALGTPTAVKTIAALFAPRERSVALGWMNAASNLGAIVTPLVVPALALHFGWAAAFFLTGAVGLLWVLVWIPAARSAAHAGTTAPADAAPGGAVAPPAADPSPRPAGRPWRDALADRATWAIAGGKLLSDPVWWLLLFWAPDFFHRRFGLTVQGFALPLAVVYTMAAAGSLFGGYASGRAIAAGATPTRARLRVMLVCALLAAPIALASHAPGAAMAVLLLGTTLAAHQGFSVNLFALTTDVAPPERVGTVISIAALCGNLAGMAVLAGAGVWLDRGHGYGSLFALAALTYLMALAWLRVCLRQPRGRPQRGEKGVRHGGE